MKEGAAMSCAVCQAVGQPLKACSRCKATFYCSVQHQEAHWKTHSAGCRAPLSRVAGSSRARAAPSPRSGGACAPGCDEEHDPLRLDYCGVCLPADSLKPPSLRTGGAEQPEGAVLLSDEEAKMYKELKALIKNIVYSKVAISDLCRDHVLVGSFKAMTDLRQFRQTVFPGTPESALGGMPKDIRELLNWEYLQLDLLKIVRSAASVLEGVALRGRLQGRSMDADTRRALAPQMVQEALAREICRSVRALGRAASKAQALGAAALAADEQRAAMDQLDATCVAGLRDPRRCLGAQREYLTGGWRDLVLRDVLRYVGCELPAFGEGSDARSCWLDGGAVEDSYPALHELCEQLRSLPHEINAKSGSELGLMQPQYADGSMRALPVLLSLVPQGCSREERVDARPGDGDSGIRLTCSYFMDMDGDCEADAVAAVVSCSVVGGGAERFEEAVVDDLLLCHRSAALRYGTGPAARSYCLLQLFAHSREDCQ